MDQVPYRLVICAANAGHTRARCREDQWALTVNQGSSDTRDQNIHTCTSVRAHHYRFSKLVMQAESMPVDARVVCAGSPHREASPCQPRARTGRKPGTLSYSQRTSKPTLAWKAAVDGCAQNDLLSSESTVNFGLTVNRRSSVLWLTTKADHNHIRIEPTRADRGSSDGPGQRREPTSRTCLTSKGSLLRALPCLVAMAASADLPSIAHERGMSHGGPGDGGQAQVLQSRFHFKCPSDTRCVLIWTVLLPECPAADVTVSDEDQDAVPGRSLTCV